VLSFAPRFFAMDEITKKASVILPGGGDEKCIEEAMAM
jgi:hypothetical protein